VLVTRLRPERLTATAPFDLRSGAPGTAIGLVFHAGHGRRIGGTAAFSATRLIAWSPGPAREDLTGVE
jgi:hypothetical protein